MIDYNKKLQPIFDTLIAHKIRPVIVGGYVRDTILHRVSKDIDVELYNIESYEILAKILKKFGTINNVGKSFGVCKLKLDILEIDFSLPREDNKIADGHKGFQIKTYKNISFKNAALRRDFTINAIGFDITTKTILDPFKGIEDLKKKQLNYIDAIKFKQDPLRILRAMQFCARFELQVTDELLHICKKMVQNNMLQELPKERIFEEFKKLLLQSKKPSLGIEFLKNSQSFLYFKELKETSYYSQKLQAMDKLKTQKLSIYFALLCYDCNLKTTMNFLQKIITDKKLIQNILHLHQYKDIFKKQENIEDYTLYVIAKDISIEDILLIHTALDNNKNYQKIKQRAMELNIYNKALSPLLQGKDLIKLGLIPSPLFSKILQKYYEKQMKGECKTKKEALQLLKRELIS